MAAKKPKPKSTALYTAITSHFAPDGGLVAAGVKLRGDDPAVQLRPMLFARSSLGQQGVDEATKLYLEDIGKAQQAREREWYGTPTEVPSQPQRVVAVKSFQDGGGNTVEVGSVWLADHRTVASAPDAFAPVID